MVGRGQVHFVDDPSTGLGERSPKSYVCVPMMDQGEALGELHLQSASAPGEATSYLTDLKQRPAITAAGSISLALAILRLRETLHIQSIRDSLTGLFNRRYMEESLVRELRRAARPAQGGRDHARPRPL